MRRARWKRKSVRDELAAHGPTHPYEGAAGTDCCQDESLLPAALKIRRWPKCVPASGGMALVGLQRGHPLLLFSLPLPHPQEGFPKGRAAARPFVPRGGMGDGGVPHVSGGGLRGRYLCAKDTFSLPYSGNYPLREQREYLLGFSVPNRYVLPGIPVISVPKMHFLRPHKNDPLWIIPDQRHAHAPGAAPAPAQFRAGDGVDTDARLL